MARTKNTFERWLKRRYGAAELSPLTLDGLRAAWAAGGAKDSEPVVAAAPQLSALREALQPFAAIPVETFSAAGREPGAPIMGWRGHVLYVADVLRARTALREGLEG